MKPRMIDRAALRVSHDATIGVLSIDGVPLAVMFKHCGMWTWYACGRWAMVDELSAAFRAAKDAVAADLYRNGDV